MAMLDLMAASVERGDPPTHIMYLSESCLPCVPFQACVDKLSGTTNWINLRSTPNNGYAVEKQFEPLKRVYGSTGMKVVKGDQWCVISGGFARRVVEVIEAAGGAVGVMLGEGAEKKQKTEEKDGEVDGYDKGPVLAEEDGLGEKEADKVEDEKTKNGDDEVDKGEGDNNDTSIKGETSTSEAADDDTEEPQPPPQPTAHRPLPPDSVMKAIFRDTTASDELVMGFLLMLASSISISPTGEIISESEDVRIGRSTYADWSESAKSPKFFTTDDLRVVLAKARDEGCLFARKFGRVPVDEWAIAAEPESLLVNNGDE